MITRTLHLNPQNRFTVTRGCMFCKQMDLTGEHARACPGKEWNIRTWTESNTDRDGNPLPKEERQ